jgi:hypothetical protein
MDGYQTLRDFVLQLTTDPQARAAFDLDPEGSLQAAGLGDLTPADVQDVIPLVADLAPAQGIADPLSQAQNLGTGLLPTGSSYPLNQLPHLADQLPIGAYAANSDVSLTALGTVTTSTTPLGGSLFAATSADGGIGMTAGTAQGTVGLSFEHDVAGILDTQVTPTSLTALDYLAIDTVGDSGLLDPTQVLQDGGLTGTATSAVDGLTSDLGGLQPLGSATGELNSVLDGASSTTGSLSGTLSGSGGLTGDLGGTVHGVSTVTGDITGDVTGGTLSGVGHVTSDLGLTGETHAPESGLLDLVDGLR